MGWLRRMAWQHITVAITQPLAELGLAPAQFNLGPMCAHGTDGVGAGGSEPKKFVKRAVRKARR